MSDQLGQGTAPATVPSPGTRGSSTALAVAGLSKSFDGVPVLRDVTFEVVSGRIHALLGGNGSGKSTTLKIVAGVYSADPGSVLVVHGAEHPGEAFTPAQAHTAGLRFVHQDLGLVDDLTVADNFGLVHGFPRRAGLMDRSALRRRASADLAAAGIAVSPRTKVADLRPSERTLVAIARALRADESGESLILVLDEPTASLPRHEVDALLADLRRRRDAATTVVYVSHRIPEVLEIADDLTVLRDGQVAYSGPTAGLTEESIISLMTGVAAELDRPPTAATAQPHDAGAAVLRVDELVCAGVGPLSLTVRPAEIVGIAGLLGSGRSRLLRALSGQLPVVSGQVRLDGEPVVLRSPATVLAAGIGYLPEDRAKEAAFSDRPLWENVSAITFPRFRRPWGFARRAERRAATEVAARYGVRAAHGGVPIGALSGGNQQKAVLARSMWSEPRLLLLDEPSQGVDAMARREIHGLVRAHVDDGGRGALVVSSDFVELASLCDRVVVLRDGQLQAELSGVDLTEDAVAHLAHRERKDPR